MSVNRNQPKIVTVTNILYLPSYFLPHSHPPFPTHCSCSGFILQLITMNSHTHTHTHARTPLDEGSARCRYLYMTHDTHNKQISIPPHPSGTRTHNPGNCATAERRLRPSGHWDQLRNIVQHKISGSYLTENTYDYTDVRRRCTGEITAVCSENKEYINTGCGVNTRVSQ